MFEAKPPRSADSFPLRDESWEGEALRELTWADLVARLSASRAVRGEFRRTDEWAASFDVSNAQRIAAHHHGELAINLGDLLHGNQPQSIAHAAVKGSGTDFDPNVARKS